MANTYTNLRYHIVFSTRDRQPWLTGERLSRMHQYLGGCVRDLGGVPLEIGGVEDHVHLLVGLKPTHGIADVLRLIKKGSSEWIRKELRRFHWQDGYSAFTVSHSRSECVRRYIVTQAAHHRKRAFADEYRNLLHANGIEFDERYLL